MSTAGSESAPLKRHLSFRSATLLVLANIIGAGIFTTTGFQAADLGHPGWIFALWAVGGVLALCGALCYAELGAMMPRSGAEYVYLTETYGRALGFMSGFVSLIAGFSAPIASACKGLSRYLTHWVPALADDPALLGGISALDGVAVGILWLLTGIQLRGARQGIRFSDAITAFKVLGILAILVAAAAFGRGDVANFVAVSDSVDTSFAVRSSAVATSLIFVMFCYSGWNASAYLAAEFENPQRDLPKSLLAGTSLVVLLYLGMNAVYFYGADVDQLAGTVEVGLVSARNLFGPTGVSAVTFVLCVSLLASANAMCIAGPRVYWALGNDFKELRLLARGNPERGTLSGALLLQAVVTTAIILTGSIDQIMQYAGFTLTLFGSLAVSCVVVLRIRRPELPRPFRTFGYPVTPLLFLAASGWMMVWSFWGRPVESSLALLTALAGGLAFWLASGRFRRADRD